MALRSDERFEMSHLPDVAGNAALAICESLLLALNDRNILPEREIVGILQDAAAAHAIDSGHTGDEDLHKAVADLINSILAGGNSVRRR
jgi:hypothetical protein